MIPGMLRRYGWILIAFALFAAWAWRPQAPAPIERPAPIAVPDARETLRRIREGGPFPYRQDGGAFQNRERLLPLRPRGWYREYTVDTPGSRDRGARRIVAGGDPPSEFWYTADHYRSFQRIDAATAVPR
jgi:guanyl-specific ribonuclease Sa